MKAIRAQDVRISTLACLGDGGVEASLKRAAALIAEAGHDKADLVCLPELFAWTSLNNAQKKRAAEPLRGRFSRAMARLAARHATNILAPLLERDGSRIYNSMVWYDRKGKVLGRYRKTFPTDYEMKAGITPGPLDFDVFQTEFGPIGCCICFDLNFRENIERIVAQKARLVVVPTMFQGLSLMRAWAKLYGIYFVSAAGYPYAAAANPLGDTLAEPWRHGNVLTLSLNLDYVVLHTDHNLARFPSIKKAYGPSVSIHIDDIESCALLTSRHPKKSAEEIVRECGLEKEADYYGRTARTAMRSREKSERGSECM